ncbi:MAG: hypothetical protein IT426_18190 [Pirellulales bacterium]|nr:hypothetical protein [Pirellulales bacterium]
MHKLATVSFALADAIDRCLLGRNPSSLLIPWFEFFVALKTLSDANNGVMIAQNREQIRAVNALPELRMIANKLSAMGFEKCVILKEGKYLLGCEGEHTLKLKFPKDAEKWPAILRYAAEDFGVGENPSGANDGGPWSKPDGPKQWAKMFNLSWDTLKGRIESGQIRAKMLSTKSYRIHVDDLPPE